MRDCGPTSRAALNPEHVARVAENARAGLAFARSRNPAIRCLTTRGTVLTSSTFTVEEDVCQVRMLILPALQLRSLVYARPTCSIADCCRTAAESNSRMMYLGERARARARSVLNAVLITHFAVMHVCRAQNLKS